MRFRLTIRDTGDRSEDLRVASRVRHDLWTHSPVEVDPDAPTRGTHRDERGRAYFEFATRQRGEVDRVLREHGYDASVELAEVQNGQKVREECQNCGNITGSLLPAVCPNCGFQDISDCPVCHEFISRQAYVREGGDLFRCPNCQSRVRMLFNDPLCLPDGHYNQPLVVVEECEVSRA